MPTEPEYWRTPVQCTNEDRKDRYEVRILWKIHTIEEIDEPTDQIPEIRVPVLRRPPRGCGRLAPLPTLEGYGNRAGAIGGLCRISHPTFREA
jgi:hypothetical protein